MAKVLPEDNKNAKGARCTVDTQQVVASSAWLCRTPLYSYTLCPKPIQVRQPIVRSFPKAQNDDVHSHAVARFSLCAKDKWDRLCRLVWGKGGVNRIQVVICEWLWHLASGKSSKLNLQAFCSMEKNTLWVTSQLKLSHRQENSFMAHTMQRNRNVKHKAEFWLYSKCLAYILEVQPTAVARGLLFLPEVTLYQLHDYGKFVSTRQHISI